MAGSLVPLGKLPLQFSRPSNCCAFDFRSPQLELHHFLHKHSQQSSNRSVSFKKLPLFRPLIYHHRLAPVLALDSNVPQPNQEVIILS